MDPGTNGPTIPGSAILVRQDKDTLLVRLAGTWKIGLELPRAGEVLEQAGGNGAFRRAAFESSGLASWDSSLAAFLFAFLRECARRGIEADIGGLPPGARKLLGMAGISSTRDGTASLKPPRAVPARAREGKAAFLRSSLELLDFIGGAALSLVRLMAGRARFRLSEILHVLHAAGPAALPVIFLISSLVGVILAFVGAVQLKMFEAQLYIADVVGIAMAREMGPMMTAIIMMGRTGASFAAHLGTMETSEEIDALRTWGIDPMEFLVLPRMLALVMMMPLLTVYADLIGILGGALIGVGMFDLTASQYLDETISALSLTHLSIGLAKSVVFGAIIAVAGCFYGMKSGRSASAVGEAATRSVVSGIVFIVVADGVFAVITHVLWI